jgi:phosphoglycolate phosphatase-like HAD superfamily hydrolase
MLCFVNGALFPRKTNAGDVDTHAASGGDHARFGLARAAAAMILFFDLDGPLLDVAPRYIALHQQLLRDHQIDGMDAESYWSAKRACRSEDEILSELGAVAIASQYKSLRLAHIETSPYLKHDRCWPWSLGCLRHLASFAPLVLVTARSDRNALLDQLGWLELRDLFHEVLSAPGGERVDRQKAALIDDYLRRHRLPVDGHWMIGDTEADVLAGKMARLKTVGVLCGIRDEAHLRVAEPDFLVPDIRFLPAILKLPPLPAENPS